MATLGALPLWSTGLFLPYNQHLWMVCYSVTTTVPLRCSACTACTKSQRSLLFSECYLKKNGQLYKMFSIKQITSSQNHRITEW